jgi:hypothetical protein
MASSPFTAAVGHVTSALEAYVAELESFPSSSSSPARAPPSSAFLADAWAGLPADVSAAALDRSAIVELVMRTYLQRRGVGMVSRSRRKTRPEFPSPHLNLPLPPFPPT